MARKRFAVGMLSVALAFAMAVLGCPSEVEKPEENPPAGSKTITVYMEKPSDWSQVYAYLWDDGGKEYTSGAPGTLLTSVSGGYHSFKAEGAEYGYVNVRFSDGSSKSSVDIFGVNTDTWYKSAGNSLAGKLLLRAGDTSSIPTPQFKSRDITDSTVILYWDPVPGIDGYILYDELMEYDDDGVFIQGSEFWHFQKAFLPGEREIYDDNYGEYLDPEAEYYWKLLAVKYKENADLSQIASIDPDYLSEDDYSPYYDVVHDFGTLTVFTKESSLPAPKNLRVVSTAATKVELAWDAVPGADYYMVEWRENSSDDWLYIEAAYGPNYIDDDDEFIKPGSSYQYRVFAYNERTYNVGNDVVTATTALTRATTNATTRAVPLNPSTISATANPTAANQIKVNWSSVSGVTKYDVGLFKTASGNPTTSKTVSNTTTHTFTNVPSSPGVYYIGVRAVNGSQKSGWKFTGSTVSAFPSISIKSATTKTSGGYKTITINMNAAWKTGTSYGYRVTVIDPKGYNVGTWVNFDVRSTNTITISNVPSGPKYTVKIEPYTGYTYGKVLERKNL